MSETEKKRVYGIDLGTTYSAIAFINDDGRAEIIANSDNERITPSVVLFEEGAEKAIVGKIAKETAKTDPDRVISFVKREMGNPWTKEIDGKTYTPEAISACILKRLANDAKDTAGHEVVDVVITCPAYFGDAERKATKAAGEIAGLNVLQILDEPAAAAMNYGLSKAEGDRTAIVYDLGGGTFDVTVVEVKDGNVRVVCSDGNHRLGGADWDNRIVNHFASEFAAASGCDKDALLSDNETLYDLRLQAEIAKQTLTKKDSTKVMISYDGNKERVELTREKFEELTRDLLDLTEETTQKMLDLAREKGIEKIHDFLLVGGSTRMPQVMAMVKEKFAAQTGTEPTPFEVDEAVAKGAALLGHIMSIQDLARGIFIHGGGEALGGEIALPEDTIQGLTDDEIELLAGKTGQTPEEIKKIIEIQCTTVASRSYGIKVSKGGQPVVYNLIKKQDPVPAEFGREFPVSEANAEKLPLIVFANNELGQIAEIDTSAEVGKAEMLLPPGLPKGAPIMVTFKLTKDGVLVLEALDTTHGTPVRATFEAKDGLSQEQIEAARVEFAGLEIE